MGMKSQRQDRRNILEAKSIGCHKIIIVPKPSNQIKASKVISQNQYWQHFHIKAMSCGRVLGQEKTLPYFCLILKCTLKSLKNQEMLKNRGYTGLSGIPGFRMPVRLPTLLWKCYLNLPSLEVKISTWNRIFSTPSNVLQVKTFAVMSSILRLTDKAWF